MKPVPLTHCFTFFTKLGGVESFLQRHVRNDAQWGMDSRVLAFFEPAQLPDERATGLGLTWRDCIGSARRKFRRCDLFSASRMIVYHNAWGLPFFADLDRASRRLSVMHTDTPVLQQTLRSQANLVDGILCVNRALKTAAEAALPRLDPGRIVVLPSPIASPPALHPHMPIANRPIVCGFVGRIVKEQKRVDRLPELWTTLNARKLDYRFELLGDGPYLSRLKAEAGQNGRVIFHGRQTGDRYWQILSSWDVILFVSDYEGLPLSLVEAMSAGVLPVYPQIGSGGDDYARAVDPEFLYPPGDIHAIAERLQQIANLPEPELERRREQGRVFARPHQGDAYERTFSEFIHRIAAEPRISMAQFPPRKFLASDYCPFGLLRRVYYDGFFETGF